LTLDGGITNLKKESRGERGEDEVTYGGEVSKGEEDVKGMRPTIRRVAHVPARCENLNEILDHCFRGFEALINISIKNQHIDTGKLPW
jgi:hypothetical protein